MNVVSVLLLLLTGRSHSSGMTTLASGPYSGRRNRSSFPIHDTVRYQLDTEDGAAEWDASMAGNGMIYLGEQCRPFSISMFHQIRCLDTLRKDFVSVQSRNRSSVRQDLEDRALTTHCMNYLRQMTFCRSRSYLDPYTMRYGGVVSAVVNSVRFE
ncbi:hypothetical protein MVEN_02473800 [Mycena venus]|uniref:Uncharacterized protein n=1 Tax=Mycena venus TaxID=2733690 RepID=A0A8H7CAM5_9AGAR|nr:hypothetical protein MVEN_02473800 [Mycena venus]